MRMFCKMSDGSEKTLLDVCQKADNATLLYFYPKDMTSGCTKQAEFFRDHYKTFVDAGIQIVGVSRDPVARHQKFIAKHELPFQLIADVDSMLCEQFGVLAEKSMYGKKYIGIVRSTFLLNHDSNIVSEWRNVKINEHMNDLIDNLSRYVNAEG